MWCRKYPVALGPNGSYVQMHQCLWIQKYLPTATSKNGALAVDQIIGMPLVAKRANLVAFIDFVHNIRLSAL